MSSTRFSKQIDRVAQSAHILEKYGQKLLKVDRSKPDQVASKLAQLRVFLAVIADDAFLPLDIEKGMEYLTYLHDCVAEDEISLSTLSVRLTELRNLVEWMLLRKEYRDDIDADVVDLLKPDRSLRNSISTAHEYLEVPDLFHMRAMLAGLLENQPEQRKQGAALRVLSGTGMRLKAVQTMQLKHIDFDRGVAFQRPLEGQEGKFGKNITMPLIEHTPGLWEPVKSWKQYLIGQHRFTDEDPLFPMLDSKPLMTLEDAVSVVYKRNAPSSGQWLQNVVKAISKAAGVKYYSPHRYRNFIARHLGSRCLDVKMLAAVSKALGHENLDTTFGYFQVQPQQAVDIVKIVADDKLHVPIPGPEELAKMTAEQKDAVLYRMLFIYHSMQSILAW